MFSIERQRFSSNFTMGGPMLRWRQAFQIRNRIVVATQVFVMNLIIWREKQAIANLHEKRRFRIIGLEPILHYQPMFEKVSIG